MNKQLLQLSKILDHYNYIDASLETRQLIILALDANLNKEFEQWRHTFSEVAKPYEPTLNTRAMQYFSVGIGQLADAGNKIRSADPNALKEAGKYVDQMISSETKTATLKHLSQIEHNPILIKQALAGATLRAIPFIGVFFSIAFALKNLYYGSKELSNVLGVSDTLGISWKDALDPKILNSITEQTREDPEKTISVDQLSKASRGFIKEFIGLIANSIDAVKDAVLAFIELVSAGSLFWIDIGLSIAIMGIQWATEGQILPDFDKVIHTIQQNVSKKYSEVMNSIIDERGMSFFDDLFKTTEPTSEV